MCRIHISLFFLNGSKCTAGHANSVCFWPDRNCTQAIWVSVNLLSDTRCRFIWKSWITAIFCELCAQSSFVIKNTSFRYYMERRWKQNAIESFLKTVRTFRGNSYIHIIHVYNSLSTLLKPPSFSALFSLKTKLLVVCSKYQYDDVSSQRFDDTSIDTAGPVLILWHVSESGPHFIWKPCLKCLANTNV